MASLLLLLFTLVKAVVAKILLSLVELVQLYALELLFQAVLSFLLLVEIRIRLSESLLYSFEVIL